MTPAAKRRYWLVKSEPGSFSFDDLLAAKNRTTHWDGVRNFKARNYLRDEMKKGDLAFFYHSNAEPSAIAGICEIVREGYPDPSAFDPSDSHFDPKSSRDDPTWYMVDVRAVKPLPRPVSLAELKARPELAQMLLIRQGRLSVSPVTPEEWATIVAMAER
jgi:predicted RNA-binding protein with PUA-like domain